MVRASVAALGGILAFACGPLAAPAAADPYGVASPYDAPSGRYYDDERVLRQAPRGGYAERMFDDDDGSRVYRYDVRPARIPAARDRSASRATVDRERYYDNYGRYDRPSRVYRSDDPRYGDRDDDYEPRYAGPASGSGASQGRRSVDPKFARATVPYNGPEPANSIVIDTSRRYLYLIQGNGSAIRYGVGVGKEGFTWKGTQTVSSKKEWPEWRPPAEMRERRPELPVMMAGGPDNPLGARALYLGNTLYRIHGSNEPWSIGHAVSSGCIRMTNEDVMDLYERVGVGTTVKVM